LDVWDAGGKWVLDGGGNLSFVVAATKPEEPVHQVHLVSLQGDRAWLRRFYDSREDANASRVLDLMVTRWEFEVQETVREPARSLPYGSLFFTDQGASVLVSGGNTRADALEFPLDLSRTEYASGMLVIGARRWTLRGFRGDHVAVEHFVEAS
jgi:hypothetical protein